MHALLDAGADVARRDREGKTVIDIATGMGDHLLAKALASRIAALAAAGNTASTAAPSPNSKTLPLSVLQAAGEQDLESMEVLIARLRLQKKDVAVALNQRGRRRPYHRHGIHTVIDRRDARQRVTGGAAECKPAPISRRPMPMARPRWASPSSTAMLPWSMRCWIPERECHKGDKVWLDTDDACRCSG